MKEDRIIGAWRRRRVVILFLLGLLGLASTGLASSRTVNPGAATVASPDHGAAGPDATVPEAPAGLPDPGAPVKQKLTRQDAEIEFSVAALEGSRILHGQMADLRFTVKDATTGAPLSVLSPSVWLDRDKPVPGEKEGGGLTCKEKIGLYMQGSLAYRPDVDLNSYFILSLNNDATISVTDPIVSFSGVTQLYTIIQLKRPGEDWAASRDDKLLFVTMPRAGQVAVVSTETFKVIQNVDAGPNPYRIALQPDGRYLWVGNDSAEAGESGVTVIDAVSRQVAARILTAPGHHEIAFSEDSRYAFVTNSREATLSIIDVGRLARVQELTVGVDPISLAYSKLGKSIFVASAGSGTVAVVDAGSHRVLSTLELEPGLRVVRITPDGRHAFVANSRTSQLLILDTATGKVVERVEMDSEPDQVTFTREFAYIRCKGSQAVVLIPLRQVGQGRTLAVSRIQYGQRPPGDSPFHAFADAIVPTPEEGHVLIANPADSMIYYYMEGMQFAMGSFRSHGGTVQRAVRVVDRGVREIERGVYGARVRIPGQGRYQVAFLLDTPRVLHCFDFSAAANPLLVDKDARLPLIEILTRERAALVGERFTLRVRMVDRGSGAPVKGVADLRLQATLAPGTWFDKYPVLEVGDGVYEASFSPARPGPHYLTFSCASLGMDARQFPNLVMTARSPPGAGVQSTP